MEETSSTELFDWREILRAEIEREHKKQAKFEFYMAQMAYYTVSMGLTKEGREKLRFDGFFYKDPKETQTDEQNPGNGQQSTDKQALSKASWLSWAFHSS